MQKTRLLQSAGGKGQQRFFTELQESASKQKLYDFGVIPIGLLDHEIFTRHKPNFSWLSDFFQQNPLLLPSLRLDFKEVWPLVALMGMEEALDELLKDNPTATDPNGHDALYFLHKGKHHDALQRRTQKHHPELDLKKRSDLIENTAVDNNQWFVSQEFISRKFELSGAIKYQLLCHAAKYNKSFFLQLAERFKDIDFGKFNSSRDNVYIAACEGGNIEGVDYILDKGWFSETAPNKRDCGTGAQIAARSRQWHLVEHFFSKFGQIVADIKDTRDRDLFDYIAMSGSWCNFELYAKQYRPKDWIPMLPHQDESSFLPTVRQTPLNSALRNGHVYFCQQFVLKYGTHYFDDYKELESDARASKNTVVIAWVAQQLQILASKVAQENNTF